MRSLLAILLLIATSAPAAEIRLREEASTIANALVRLGSVATVTGDDAERLAKLPLMPNPSPGTRQFVSAASIRDMLAAQGESVGVHHFTGAYRVLLATPALAAEPVVTNDQWRPAAKPSNSMAFRVRRGTAKPQATTVRRTRVLSQQAVNKAVNAAVQHALDAKSTKSSLLVREVQLSATAARELAELGDQPITAEFLPTTQLLPGLVSVRLRTEARRDDEAFQAIVELVEQPMRVVTTQPVGRGTMLTASAVKLEPVLADEIDRPRLLGYTTLDAVVGREASRPLQVGDVVSMNNTAAPLMVRRNEEVEVSSGGGGVSVRLLAIAKQDGREGELITIQTLDRDEKFTARVVGPRRLAILSAGGNVANSNRPGGVR